jgi:hypothetical protein
LIRAKRYDEIGCIASRYAPARRYGELRDLEPAAGHDAATDRR